MVSVRRTFTVHKPLETVVDYLKDFGHAEAWDPGTKSCVRQGEGAIDVGARWHNVSEFRGRDTELEYRLDQVEPRRLVFVGTNKTATSTDDLSFEPVGDDTAVTYHATIEFNGVVKLAGPFLRSEFEKLGDQVAVSMPQVIDALPS
jgi:carbon monoxide dehydrogenase subunit G